MDEFEKNQQIVRRRNEQISERKKLNDQRRKIYAKKRLEHNITKKIKTTMIGALASFEDFFGELWGIDMNLEELNEQQLRWLDTWEETRKDILNNGNVQIRAAQDEISEYDAEWTGQNYEIDFIIKKDYRNE
jgi:hypothetical protein